MRWVLLSLLVLTSSCDELTQASNSEDHVMSDAESREILSQNPGLKKSCLHGDVPMWHDNPNCFEMTPPHRWSGLWESGWEWTNFCPAPARECPISAEKGDIWLEFADGAYSGPDLVDGLYEIEFVGRRSKIPGRFGHLSQYDHLMIVDRIISVRLLQAKPPE